MDLSNLTIHFLGDSITQYHAATSEDTAFVGLFRKKYPNAIIYNYGIGGSCISDCCIWDVEDMRIRAKRMEPDADLIVVFGGTNDFNCMAPLGAPEDRTPDTFRGACNLLLDDLLSRYPNAKIVICTPLHRFDETLPERDGHVRVAPLSEYVRIVRETARDYGCDLIDLYKLEEFRTESGVKSPLTRDGLHPMDEGHAIIFAYMDNALRKMEK